MRQLTTNEVLALNKFLQMETNSLAMAKAGINVISDQQLKTLSESGITATEARIRGLQQFISENNVMCNTNAAIGVNAVNTTMTATTTTTANANTSSNNNNNIDLPKGVM